MIDWSGIDWNPDLECVCSDFETCFPQGQPGRRVLPWVPFCSRCGRSVSVREREAVLRAAAAEEAA